MRIRRPRGYPKKECSTCGNPVEEDRRNQKQRLCRKCHNKYMRLWRKKKKKEMKELKNKLKQYAATSTNNTQLL